LILYGKIVVLHLRNNSIYENPDEIGAKNLPEVF